ncbi:MAG: F0F1 ATP synthase subunit B [Verrucomicrobiota bacterium]
MIHTLLLLAQTEPAEQDIMTTLGVNLSGFIAQCIIFVVLAFLLKKYAFGPIQEVLEKRRIEIAESLSNADKIKKELAEAESTRKELIKKAQDQASLMISEAQKRATEQGEKKLQEAVAEAESVIRKGRESISLDREKMLADLRKEVVALVVETTSKVSGKVLSIDDQNRLKDETVKQLAA